VSAMSSPLLEDKGEQCERKSGAKKESSLGQQNGTTLAQDVDEDGLREVGLKDCGSARKGQICDRVEDERPRLTWHLLVEERGGEGFSAARVHVAFADLRVAVRASSVLVASLSESRSPQLTLRRAVARLGSVVRLDPLGRGRSRRTARSAVNGRVSTMLNSDGRHINTHLVDPTTLERLEDMSRPHALGRDEAGL
jgi:hypothetical protein